MYRGEMGHSSRYWFVLELLRQFHSAATWQLEKALACMHQPAHHGEAMVHSGAARE
jgi:hypothetical protein